jgi:DNA-binding XRE family transcriptional regulator
LAREHPCVAFCHFTLTAPKPAKTPQILKTWGDHLLKRRLELNLFQREVAHILGVNATTIMNWERHHTEPQLYLLPRSIQFLGYDPRKKPIQKSLGQQLIEYRKTQGLSQRKLAKLLGIDPETLGRWERNEGRPERKLKIRVEPFLRTLLEKDGAPEE